MTRNGLLKSNGLDTIMATFLFAQPLAFLLRRSGWAGAGRNTERDAKGTRPLLVSRIDYFSILVSAGRMFFV